jgi:hypothetical protein
MGEPDSDSEAATVTLNLKLQLQVESGGHCHGVPPGYEQHVAIFLKGD